MKKISKPLALFILVVLAIVFFAWKRAHAEDLNLLPTVPPADLFSKIMAWVIGVNLLLSGISAALEKIMGLTSSNADNKAYAALSKVLGVLQKVVDFASANIAHKKK